MGGLLGMTHDLFQKRSFLSEDVTVGYNDNQIRIYKKFFMPLSSCVSQMLSQIANLLYVKQWFMCHLWVAFSTKIFWVK